MLITSSKSFQGPLKKFESFNLQSANFTTTAQSHVFLINEARKCLFSCPSFFHQSPFISLQTTTSAYENKPGPAGLTASESRERA